MSRKKLKISKCKISFKLITIKDATHIVIEEETNN